MFNPWKRFWHQRCRGCWGKPVAPESECPFCATAPHAGKVFLGIMLYTLVVLGYVIWGM